MKKALEDQKDVFDIAIGTIKMQREAANDQVVDLNVAAQTGQKRVKELEEQIAVLRQERAAIQDSEKTTSKAKTKTAN